MAAVLGFTQNKMAAACIMLVREVTRGDNETSLRYAMNCDAIDCLGCSHYRRMAPTSLADNGMIYPISQKSSVQPACLLQCLLFGLMCFALSALCLFLALEAGVCSRFLVTC